MKTFAIIPAAGKGVRSGFAAPKQYLKIQGKELIVYTLEIFQKNKLVDEIIISADPAYFKLLQKLKEKYRLTKLLTIVEGGKERQDSVYNALKVLKAKANDLIAVHDAARPLLPASILTNSILSAKKNGNALVCVKAKDTLIKGKDKVESYINRNEIYFVQTPQIFRYKDLMSAMKKAYSENFYGTDESMLVNRLGKKIHIAEGSIINFKVTTKTDLELFKNSLKK
ncbi:MAG: 2-C-methyl-D-erythritol 4-phosphate cytidylyltransferase [Ignavibacteriaceae bacterium]